MLPTKTYSVMNGTYLRAHIKSLRKLRGMTQADLGVRINVKQSRIVEIENNPGSVSLNQLLQVLHALDCRLLLADKAIYAPPPLPPGAANW